MQKMPAEGNVKKGRKSTWSLKTSSKLKEGRGTNAGLYEDDQSLNGEK